MLRRLRNVWRATIYTNIYAQIDQRICKWLDQDESDFKVCGYTICNRRELYADWISMLSQGKCKANWFIQLKSEADRCDFRYPSHMFYVHTWAYSSTKESTVLYSITFVLSLTGRRYVTSDCCCVHCCSKFSSLLNRNRYGSDLITLCSRKLTF